MGVAMVLYAFPCPAWEKPPILYGGGDGYGSRRLPAKSRYVSFFAQLLIESHQGTTVLRHGQQTIHESHIRYDPLMADGRKNGNVQKKKL